MLLNICNLAVQLFRSDFVVLYSAASFSYGLLANKEYFYPSRFTRHDVIALCLAIFIPVIVVVLTLVAVLPALGAPPLPNFEDPTKVF